MGRLLRVALFAEGRTDARMLPPLLLRLLESLLGHRQDVDLPVELPVEVDADKADQPLSERVSARMHPYLGSVDLLFVHADADADESRAWRERVDPAVAGLAREAPKAGAVGVVPVRSSEAWLLVDAAALLAAVGSGVDELALALPRRAAAVEEVADPKAALAQALGRALGRPRPASSEELARFAGAVAQRVDLERLASVPSWRGLLERTAAALERVGFLDPLTRERAGAVRAPAGPGPARRPPRATR